MPGRSYTHVRVTCSSAPVCADHASWVTDSPGTTTTVRPEVCELPEQCRYCRTPAASTTASSGPSVASADGALLAVGSPPPIVLTGSPAPGSLGSPEGSDAAGTGV